MTDINLTPINYRINTPKINPELLSEIPSAVSDKTLRADTVTISSKQRKSAVIATGLGALALGAILGIKKIGSNAYLSRAQKAFQEVFMRDNITVAETKEILQRYKNLAKIEDKEEYLKAMFEEAKKNFGFGDSKIKLILKEGEKSKAGQTMGGAHITCDSIEVTPSLAREKIIDTMHHEFRHMKQHQVALQYDAQGFMRAEMESPRHIATMKSLGYANPKFNKAVADATLKDILENLNMQRFDRADLPEKYHEFARKLLEAQRFYVDGHDNFLEYFRNFAEADARNSGRLMANLLKNIPEIT